jgi:hypothetical protein
MSAEFDYAFLAEYATANRGTITAVGASYTEVAAKLPVQHQLSIAGRVRTRRGDPPPELEIQVIPSNKGFILQYAGQLPDDANAVSYADRVGYVFALSTGITLDEPGLYEVVIKLDGQDVRHLFFTVVALD